jgi:WD40 repeat protein
MNNISYIYIKVITISLIVSSCFSISPNDLSTPTSYILVSEETPIPLVYESITFENSHLITLLANWKINTQAESLNFTQSQEFLCIGNQTSKQSWDIYTGSTISTLDNCELPLFDKNNGRRAISADNNYLAKLEPSGSLTITNLLRPTTFSYYYLDSTVSVVFSSSGEYIALAFQNGEIWFFPKSDWEEKLVSLEDDYSYNDPNPVPELRITTEKVPSQILFSPTDSFLAILFKDQTIQIWNLSDFSLFATINNEFESDENQSRIYEMAFSPDNKILATASTNSTIILWDVSKEKPLVKLKGHKDNVPVSSLVFSPSGRILASLYNGYFVYVWGVLPENLEIAKISSTAIANSLSTPIVLFDTFPQPTVTPTSSLPIYQSQLPQRWPILMPTQEQILEAKGCSIEALAEVRYPENINYWDLEHAYPLVSSCDWAVLSFAYQLRFDDKEKISEDGKRAFIEAIKQNSAFALNKPLFYIYFNSFELVDIPPIANQPVKSISINYEWFGNGDPSHLKYDIEIRDTQTLSNEFSLNINSQPQKLIIDPSESINPEVVQKIGSALTDFLPIQSPFTLENCVHNTSDWTIIITFLNDDVVTLKTYESNLLTTGGPWFMEIEGQFYVQFSSKITQAVFNLFDSIGLPLGQPYSTTCYQIDPIELAYP